MFIEVALFSETSPALKNSWLRPCILVWSWLTTWIPVWRLIGNLSLKVNYNIFRNKDKRNLVKRSHTCKTVELFPVLCSHLLWWKGINTKNSPEPKYKAMMRIRLLLFLVGLRLAHSLSTKRKVVSKKPELPGSALLAQ